MQSFQRMKLMICFLFSHNFILLIVTAYPIQRIDPDNSELKDERRYPNGTVVGTYTYKDREGNPVHVKYFADDSSYGVELKSFKVMDSKYPFQQQKSDFSAKTGDLKVDKAFGLFDDKTQPVPKSDFDIYMENEVKPEKCVTEKVRVYYDKNNKRKVRNAFNPFESISSCQEHGANGHEAHLMLSDTADLGHSQCQRAL
ncbi:uncharacterized protein LOC123708407 [Pieris brassicae]|uniref:uncharacterized protein LOC123708407 n=1 Tax=Pieris brassicae TaxID=7116 RepID=UPI001E661BC8|nr:uncharacterized protein LOC123708407 [Pieris brassicae]